MIIAFGAERGAVGVIIGGQRADHEFVGRRVQIVSVRRLGLRDRVRAPWQALEGVLAIVRGLIRETRGPSQVVSTAGGLGAGDSAGDIGIRDLERDVSHGLLVFTFAGRLEGLVAHAPLGALEMLLGFAVRGYLLPAGSAGLTEVVHLPAAAGTRCGRLGFECTCALVEAGLSTCLQDCAGLGIDLEVVVLVGFNNIAGRRMRLLQTVFANLELFNLELAAYRVLVRAGALGLVAFASGAIHDGVETFCGVVFPCLGTLRLGEDFKLPSGSRKTIAVRIGLIGIIPGVDLLPLIMRGRIVYRKKRRGTTSLPVSLPALIHSKRVLREIHKVSIRRRHLLQCISGFYIKILHLEQTRKGVLVTILITRTSIPGIRIPWILRLLRNSIREAVILLHRQNWFRERMITSI